MDACLSEHDLDALARGLATPEQRDRSNRHVETCAACRARLAEKHAEFGGCADAAGGSPGTIDERGSRYYEGAFAPGVRLGDFRIEKPLGAGGMGVVYRARQLSLNRQVALKVIRPGLGITSNALRRFHREARAAAKLHHTNIVAVHAEGEDRSVCYYAMELIEGQSLAEIIAGLRQSDLSRSAAAGATVPPGAAEPGKAGATPPTGRLSGSGLSGSGSGRDHFDTVAELVADVADALDYAHSQGVIHRDIKPSNLMLDRDGRLKMMDFGLARVLEEPGMTVSGELLGTPRYMSPEQIVAGRMKIDHRTDVYSLGATLYELLTLRPPFTGEHRDEIIAEIVTKEPPRPRRLQKRVPVDLETICLKAIEKDPDRRYQTAGALGEDLRRYVNRYAISAKRVGPLGRLAKFVRRNKLSVAAAAAIVILASVVGVMTWQYRSEQEKARVEQEQRLRVQREAEAERYLWAAQKFHAEGRYQDALTQIKASLERGPDRLEARLLHARLLFEHNQSADAAQDLEQLAEKYPEEGAVHVLLATIYAGRDPTRAKQHQQRAEQLVPETPDAYYLRAVTAATFKEKVQWLSEGLQLDPSHYPSLRARALTYYILKDYGNMERDADRAVTLRPRDASAWLLRGLAKRKAGRLDDALADQTRAADFAPEDPEVFDQRRQTYRLVGDLDRELADARRCVQLNPDEVIYRFHVFTALVSLQDYVAAARTYTQLVEGGTLQKQEVDNWARKYVFDAMAGGWPVSLPEATVPCRGFSEMREAADYYRTLSRKARRVVPEGFEASWSPDGKQLAYSRGVPGCNAIEILDWDSGTSRLLAVPGKDPKWSPDRRYVAFVREPQHQPITESDFSRAPRHQHSREEVWIVKPDGSGLRLLAANAGWPSWASDSKGLYFISRAESTLCFIRIAPSHANPTSVMPCPGRYPAVSPDGQYVAYALRSELRIVDVPAGSLVARWRAPTAQSGMLVAWSPDGRELSIGGYEGAELGLWIFEVETQTAWRVFAGEAKMGVWSPDRSRLAFDVRSPYWDIWVAELDPNVPTRQALGPAQTREEYLQEYCKARVDRYTRAIEADPDDFEAYCRRGDIYARLGRWDEVAAEYTQAIRTRPPENIRPYRVRAEAYLQLKEYEKAATDYDTYRKLLEAGEYSAAGYNNLAWTYVTGPQQIRDPEKALPLALKAIELEPENIDWLNTLGVVYYRLGQFDDAIETLLRSAKGSKEGGTAFDFFFLAMSYQQLGQPEKAKEAYDKALGWWDARKPLSPQWSKELTACRAEADLVLGKH